MHMDISISTLTLLLPHIAINYNIASSYIATTPAFQYIFQMCTIHPSYNICELLSTIVGNLCMAIPCYNQALINYWLIQTLNTGDRLYIQAWKCYTC